MSYSARLRLALVQNCLDMQTLKAILLFDMIKGALLVFFLGMIMVLRHLLKR